MNLNRLLGRLTNYVTKNALYLRVKAGSAIHKKALLKGAVIKGDVSIGEGARVIGGVYISGKVSIGRFTSVNGPNTDIYSKVNRVTIGNFCSIARNVSIQEFNHQSDGITTYYIHKNLFKTSKNEIASKGEIEIGNDVWISTHCVVLSGTKIGDGAIIGANSVVSGEIPPYAIAAGNPAKVLKYRFDEDTIRLMMEMKWWNWDIERLKRNQALFSPEGPVTTEWLKKVVKE
jgi:virginiamycin A acetyltransferase